MNRGQYYLAQFGRGSERRLSLSLLLDPSDLPGIAWKIIGERSWRGGKDDQRDAASLRAKRSGAFVAMRSFEQRETSRWAILKVIPMVSSEDALLVLPETKFTLITAPKSHAVFEAERSIDLDLDLGLSNVKATEIVAFELNKVATYRIVVGAVDSVIAAICCSGWGDGWTWSEIQVVATAQVRKIRSIASN